MRRTTHNNPPADVRTRIIYLLFSAGQTALEKSPSLLNRPNGYNSAPDAGLSHYLCVSRGNSTLRYLRSRLLLYTCSSN